MPMQKITVRLPIEKVPDELRENLRKAGITTLPQSVSVTALTDSGAEITTIYGIEAPPGPLQPAEKVIKQEKDDRDNHRHLQSLKDTLKDEKIWITQEQKFINREDNLIREMDTRSPDYQRRMAALKARKAKLTTRCNLQGARRQQILAGDALAKQAKHRHNNSRFSGSAPVYSTQQRLPAPLPTALPTSYEGYRPRLPPPPGLKRSYDYSTAPWNPPPPPPASAFRPYQPGMFDFDKFIPSSTPKYVEPPKTFNFDKFISSTASTVKPEPHSLGQGGVMHPSRLALLEQGDEPEVIFKTEGEIHFPSSSFQFGGGKSFDRTGANMEPLARKRPSPSKEEPLAKKHAPSWMGEWVVEANITPARFKPAPSILHGYGHLRVAPVSLQTAHPSERTADHQFPVENDTPMDCGYPVSPERRASFNEIVPASQAPQFCTPEVDIAVTANSPSLAEQFAEIEKAVDRMAESSGIEKLDGNIKDVSSELPSSKAPFVFEQSVPKPSRPLSETSGIREIPSEFPVSKVPFVLERSVLEASIKLSENTPPVRDAGDCSQGYVSGISQVRLLENSASVKEVDMSAMYQVRESHKDAGSVII